MFIWNKLIQPYKVQKEVVNSLLKVKAELYTFKTLKRTVTLL